MMLSRQRIYFATLVLLICGLIGCNAWGSSRNPDSFGQNIAFGEAAQEDVLVDPMTLQARFQPSQVEVGGTSELLIEMNFADGYHAYLDRFKLSIEWPDDLKLAPFKISPIITFHDVVTKTQKQGVTGKSQMRALIEVPPGFNPGDYVVKAQLTYQACTKEFCLFPKKKMIEVPIKILPSLAEGGTATSAPQAATFSKEPPARDDFKNALSKGTLAAFFFVFVVGFLTSLTPCVYPMIPITLAVLGARAEKNSPLKNFSFALTYVLGLALTYAVLGVIAASTGGLFGSLLGNPWVVGAIALIFAVMGLSLLGLYDIQAPAFIRNKLGVGQLTQNYAGAFVTGLIAGIVASPCVGPVLVGILTYIAQTQDRGFGFFLLFTFAFGMGLPFLALGFSSALITHLPKAGPWMNGIKTLFGVVMIGMAFYYLKPVAPAWFFNLSLGLTLIAGASHFGAFDSVANLGFAAKLRKGLMIAVLLAGALLSAGELLKFLGVNLPGFTSQERSPTFSPVQGMNWQPYSDALLEEAANQGKPVIIDFWAEWCEACNVMEATTLIDPKVIELGRSFTLLKVDGTVVTPELKKVLSRFKVFGFPTYLFIDKNGKLREDLSLFGATSADDFAARMSATLR